MSRHAGAPNDYLPKLRSLAEIRHPDAEAHPAARHDIPGRSDGLALVMALKDAVIEQPILLLLTQPPPPST